MLATYPWPMNVREVVQVARQMSVLHGEAKRWSASLLPDVIQQPTSPSKIPPAGSDTGMTRTPTEIARETDSAQLLAALDECGGNLSQAAAKVGISRQRAYRLLRYHPDVDLEGFRNK
jgi:transcriptional regulator of acetoin/glycerol metabolism